MYRIVLDNGKEQVVLESDFTCEQAAQVRCNVLRIMSDIRLYLFIEPYEETTFKYWETVC